MYYRMSFYQNILKDFLYNKANKGENDLCRMCSSSTENIKHVFEDCLVLDHGDLKIACARHTISYNVHNVLTKDKLKRNVELFLQKKI